jgi:hypothetical protein
MTDFAIRVKGIPHHLKYDDVDSALRAVLITHFEHVIKDEIIIFLVNL